MSMEAISALGADLSATGSSELSGLGAAGPQAASGVFDAVLDGLNDLNSRLLASQEHVAQLALGHMDGLQHVAMSSEQTRLSFELALAVRNKVLDAYQELMRMQV